jgi:hypothetical protein
MNSRPALATHADGTGADDQVKPYHKNIPPGDVGAQKWSTDMKSPQFEVGDRVEDTESHRRGTVVYQFRSPCIDCLVAVKFEGRGAPLACHVDDLRRVRS